MFEQFSQRSLELEHLDKGDYTPDEYEGCVVELQRVNRWMGDVSALRESLLVEIENLNLDRFAVIDVGAGSGELLRVIARWARKTNRSVQLTGVELNSLATRAIAEQSRRFPEISALRADGFRLPFADNQIDYAICSLFTHHFKNDDLVLILQELSRVAFRGIFVIDLHRHPVPYYFFTTIGRLFLHNRLIREDGALSILRSFVPEELKALADRAGLEQVKVTRHFPYRLVLAASPTESAGVLGASSPSRAKGVAAPPPNKGGRGCRSAAEHGGRSCGFAVSIVERVAASPPSSAERLRLSEQSSFVLRRLRLRSVEA